MMVEDCPSEQGGRGMVVLEARAVILARGPVPGEESTFESMF